MNACMHCMFAISHAYCVSVVAASADAQYIYVATSASASLTVYFCCYICQGLLHCRDVVVLLLLLWYISVYLFISAATSVEMKGDPPCVFGFTFFLIW